MVSVNIQESAKVSKKISEDWPRKLLQNLPYYRLATREPEDSFVNQPKDCNERKLCFEVRISPVCFDYFCLSVKLCVKSYHFKWGYRTSVYPTCDHSFARAPTLKPQGAEKAVYCEGMNYAIV